MRTIILLLAFSFTNFTEAQYQAIYTTAGNDTSGYTGDFGLATSAQLNSPSGIAVDGSGNQFIADYGNHCIRNVAANTGIITTVAGTGTPGFSGDGGAATSAELYFPTGIAVDSKGNIYVADFRNYRIRKINSVTGIITTVAGCGKIGYSGDGGQATLAEISPTGVALDAAGNIYVADNLNSRIRAVNASTGVITTIAGNGTKGYSGDNGPATSAELFNPWSVALDISGNIYVGDLNNHVVREIMKSSGKIVTVAGNVKLTGFSGDGGPATNASLSVYGIAVDSSGNIYISDFANSRIRKVTASSGIISTIAGNGSFGFYGNRIGAILAEINSPHGLAVDGIGNLFIADLGNNIIRKISGILLNKSSSTCNGYADTITASNVLTNYSWAPSAGLNTTKGFQVIATPLATTTYTVTGSRGSLKDSTFVTLIVYGKADSLLFSEAPSCRDSSISISVTGARSYLWSPGNLSGSVVSVSPSGPTTYTIMGTDSNGCVLRSTRVFTLNSIFTEITQQPVNQTALVNSSALIYLIARGTNSYQWQQNDGLGFVNLYDAGPFSGVHTDSLTVSGLTTLFNNSLYRCIITNGICSDTSQTMTLTVKNVSGIENFSWDVNVLEFPNPCNGIFTIQTKNSGSQLLEIFDFTGKLMFSEIFSSSTQVIDASGLSEGIYNLCLTASGGERGNKRLVVVR